MLLILIALSEIEEVFFWTLVKRLEICDMFVAMLDMFLETENRFTLMLALLFEIYEALVLMLTKFFETENRFF